MTSRLPSVNENTGVLKLIALVCMIVDHVGSVFYPGVLWLRVIGRIAFPLYCWCLVVGAEYTRDVFRYGLRLLVLGLISQPFYCLALNHSWYTPNIFLTLLLGLVGIWGLRSRQYWPTVLAVVISHYAGADYGLRGVLCVIVLYLLRKNPYALAVGFACYCVAWAQSASVSLTLPWDLGMLRLNWGGRSVVVARWGIISLRLQTFALLALPLMLYPMKGLLRLPGRIAYWGYPAHLAVLYALKLLLV